MKKYYVNSQAQANGDHEVHTSTCSFLPSRQNQIYLGEFASCQSALNAAKVQYNQVDGCIFCVPACHKS